MLVAQAQTTSSVRRAGVRSVMGADDMLGFDVADNQGTRVGELWDIMLDLRTGRVAYGVVSLERAPRWSERLVAVPWNIIHMDGERDCLVVNAKREWIERAPSMRPEFLSNLLDREWAVLIHAYFGARPYWEQPVAQAA